MAVRPSLVEASRTQMGGGDRTERLSRDSKLRRSVEGALDMPDGPASNVTPLFGLIGRVSQLSQTPRCAATIALLAKFMLPPATAVTYTRPT